MTTAGTIATEDKYAPPFFTRIPVSIERGAGVYAWDEEGNRFIDFTSGWGVTCLGHAHPAIINALLEQGRKLLQSPNAGLTYSPIRAHLMLLLGKILPPPLTRVFFSNSGAEANDAAIKLARKVTGRLDVIAMELSFHGRTISTASATGQAKHREKFNPLMPNYRFVPYDDLPAMQGAISNNVAAVILEPVQGEGGVKIPAADYLAKVSRLCKENGTLLIVDEIQTGFCRTGPMFAIDSLNVEADFLTMAKGIAGGFPFGAFAMSEAVAAKLEPGDHGGTYCGNPLGCAVASAVIQHLLDHDISTHVASMGDFALKRLRAWMHTYPALITDVRGRGLLLLLEFRDEKTAGSIADACFKKRLFVRQTQGNMIRVFPALNILQEELEEGLGLLGEAIESAAHQSPQAGGDL